MHEFQWKRRQALIASGLGTMSFGMPGVVMGADKVDASVKSVAAEKSCIFVLLCGGPSHVDTWDMKPEAPLDYRGPYQWSMRLAAFENAPPRCEFLFQSVYGDAKLPSAFRMAWT